MPSSHRRHAGCPKDRPSDRGPGEQILEARPHPEQGYRACLGIVRLVGSYGAARVEAAAERAIEIGAKTYGSVKSILDNELNRRSAQNRPRGRRRSAIQTFAGALPQLVRSGRENSLARARSTASITGS